MTNIDLSFYLVLSFQDNPSVDLLRRLLRLAIGGGVTVVQLRLKNASSTKFEELAKVCQSCIDRPVVFLINDRVELMKRVNADGVHLGQTDMSVENARAILGPEAIIGLSVENKAQLIRAANLPIDYVGISPIFQSQTKPELQTNWGTAGLKEAVTLSPHPCVAIGGIKLGNVSEVLGAQPAGIAVCSAVVEAKSPALAIQHLKRLTAAHLMPSNQRSTRGALGDQN